MIPHPLNKIPAQSTFPTINRSNSLHSNQAKPQKIITATTQKSTSSINPPVTPRLNSHLTGPQWTTPVVMLQIRSVSGRSTKLPMIIERFVSNQQLNPGLDLVCGEQCLTLKSKTSEWAKAHKKSPARRVSMFEKTQICCFEQV